jgi:dynein heavy chain
VLDAAFASLSRLPQIETSCLPQLFPVNNISYLSAVQREEPDVERLHGQLQALLLDAIQPLHAYIGLYECHLPFLLLNIDEHIKDLQRQGQDSLDSLQSLVDTYTDRRADIEAAIPKQVNLGLTLVNCEDVRRKVLNKYTEMTTKLLETLQRIARSRCEEVTKAVKKVEVEVKRTPIDIVELTKLREYLLTVPSTINAFKSSIYTDVMASFDLLDHFHCKVPKELLKLKWTVYAYPKALSDMLQQREAQLQSDSALFLQEMRGQQDELNADINDVEKRINGLSHLHDFDALDKVNERCEATHAAILAIQAKARQYNSNELLFPSTNTTDYAIVSTLAKRFDDYYLLFTTAFQWSRSSQQWRYGNFLELDGEAIQTAVDVYSKNLGKVLKAKAIKDNTSHFTLATACKREVDAFKAMLPLLMALRNPGMKERHWKLLADKLPYNFSFMMAPPADSADPATSALHGSAGATGA